MQPSEGHGAGGFGARWTWVAVAAGNLQGSWFSNPYRTHQYSIHRRKKCKAIESMWCNSGSLNIFNIMSAMQCSNVSSCIICPPSRGCHFMRQAFSFSLCVSPVPHAAEINQQNHPKHPPNGLVRCRTRSNILSNHTSPRIPALDFSISFWSLASTTVATKEVGVEWPDHTGPILLLIHWGIKKSMPKAVLWLKPDRSMNLCACYSANVTTRHPDASFIVK